MQYSSKGGSIRMTSKRDLRVWRGKVWRLQERYVGGVER